MLFIALLTVLLAATVTPYVNIHRCKNAGLTEDERHVVLMMYNRMRVRAAKGRYFRNATLLPFGMDLRLLTWDCSLESMAEKAVRRCPRKETPHPNYAQHFQHMKELGWQKITPMLPVHFPSEDPKKGFEEESSSLIYNGNPIFRNYANIMRANTTKIGCSVARCSTGDGNNVATGICYFDSPEMKKGDTVYEIGFPCDVAEDCPNEHDVCVGLGLCYNNRLAKRAMQIHNKHRSDLALGKVKNKMGNYFPTSIREYEMALSLELEKKALEYARDWEHDNTGWKMGLWYKHYNDTWVSGSVINNAADDVDALEKAIKIWWKDRKLVDDEDMKVMFDKNCYRNEATRRFVMIARGYNSLMGCAVDKKKKQHNVVCVYETGSSAHTDYQPLYEIGEPCGATTCFNQASPRFCSRGLCASYAEASVRVFSNEMDDKLL